MTKKTSSEHPRLSIEHLISIASLIIALLALFISIRSCAQAERSLEMSEVDFVAARLAIWRANPNSDGSGWTISSTDPEIVLQRAAMLFPPQMYPGEVWEITIDPPEFELHFESFDRWLMQLVKTSLDRPDEDHLLVGNAFVPVVVESTYVAKGNLFQDRSLYHISYFLLFAETEEPELQYNGLEFQYRLSPETDPMHFLGELWEEGLRQSNE